MTPDTPRTREGWVWLLLCAAMTLGGCSDSAGGPEYLDLSVSAEEDGSSEAERRCTPIPVMPGARTLRELIYASAFGVEVEATREQVTVTFLGILDPEDANRTILRSSLEGGFGVNDIRVETTGGRRFTVGMTCPCPESTTP